jgi:opacity protein-like surface antigen
MTRIVTTLVTAVLAMAAGAPAAAADVAGVFSRGRTHVAVVGGTGYAFDDSYLVLGVGASYYLADGLNVGLYAESWTSGDPGMYKLTPSVQYVFYQVPRVSPYVGVFFRRTYIDNLPNLDSAGGRAGVYFAAGRNLYLSAGLVYESYLDCDKTTYKSCSDSYPEFGITFAF